MSGNNIPTIHRERHIRLRPGTRVLTETTDYRVVEGYNRSQMRVISKNGGASFDLPRDNDKPLYPSQIGLEKQTPVSVIQENVFAPRVTQKERV